jgi:hypothetical protein
MEGVMEIVGNRVIVEVERKEMFNKERIAKHNKLQEILGKKGVLVTIRFK